MADNCVGQVQACYMRITRLEPNGVPDPGANNMVVTDALVTAAFAWQVEEGDSIRKKNACGAVAIDYKGPSSLLRGQLTITLVTPDPYASEMLSNGTILTDVLPGDDAIGYAAPAIGLVDQAPVSIELWTKRIGSDGKQDPDFPWAWWVYPWTENWRPGDHTHQNDSLDSVFIGDATENDNWYNGPSNNWPTECPTTSVYQWIPTTYTPTVTCGYYTLSAS